MTYPFQHRLRSLAAALVILLPAAACGSSDPVAPPDPDLAPVVGEWSATTLIQTSKEDPQLSVDLIELGATFTLTIEENGRYEAILDAFGRARERGVASVEGSTLTLDATDPDNEPTTATFQLDGNQLTLDGDSRFDFGGDGVEEAVPTDLHIELVKR